MDKEEEMKCVRCGGDYKVVATCASSPDAISCLYCREFYILEFRHKYLQKHLHKLTDWLYDNHPEVVSDFFRNFPNG